MIPSSTFKQLCARWFRKRGGPRRAGTKKHQWRPEIQLLEDRCVPAIGLVSGANPVIDSATANESSYLHAGPGMSISQDGRYLVYESLASNLVAGQTDENAASDIFLRDLLSGTTTLVSRASSSATTAANGESANPTITADGRYVVFRSSATNLVNGVTDANDSVDVFLFDRVASTMTLVSRSHVSASTTANGGAGMAAISADGNYVVFVSSATDHLADEGDDNAADDVFLFARSTGTVTLVSRASSGATVSGDGISDNPSISADGRFVVYQSAATNLVADVTDENGSTDIFVYDRVDQTTTLVSHNSETLTVPAFAQSENPVISSDGAFIAFASYAADLVAEQDDGNGTLDVFLYERASGAITLVSRSNGGAAQTGDNFSDAPALSADGRYVAFRSAASNLVGEQIDDNGDLDIFLYDAVAGTTTLVSHAAGLPTTAGNFFSDAPAISADGTRVVFTSVADNLIADGTDTNETLDVFLYDAAAGSVQLISHATATPTTAGNSMSERPELSGTGGMIVFQSMSDDLVGNDANALVDVFFYSLPANLAPTLDGIASPAPVQMNAGVQTIQLTGISAGAGESQMLTITAVSSNPALIPHPTVSYTSPDSTGSLSFTPVANQAGTATITVTVQDDGGTAHGGVDTVTRTFTVTVATPANVQSFVDEDNDAYTVRLRGPGQLFVAIDDVDGNGKGPIASITVQNTDAVSSILEVIVHRRVGLASDREVAIGSITGSPLRTISAPASDLVGAGINLAGHLGSLIMDDVRAGAAITTLGTAAQRSTVTLGQVDDGASMNMGSTLAYLKAAGVARADITAPAITVLSVKQSFDADLTLSGNPTAATALGSAVIGGGVKGGAWNITGDVLALAIKGYIDNWDLDISGNLSKATLGRILNADITVAGAIGALSAASAAGGTITAASIRNLISNGAFNADVHLTGSVDPLRPVTLQSAVIRGDVTGAAWDIVGSVGVISVRGRVSETTIDIHGSGAGISKFTARGFDDSRLLVGLASSAPSDPWNATNTFSDGWIGSFAVTGKPVPAFVNSTVAAARIGKVAMSTVAVDNGGAMFGILADTSIGSVRVKYPAFVFQPAQPTPQGMGDFVVTIV